MSIYPTDYPAALGLSYTKAKVETIGEEWDIAIDFEGYLLSTLDQEVPFEFRSYEVQELEPQKPRIDTSEEAGEQTLGDWWTRSQTSWLRGAGQQVFDGPISERQKSRDIFGFLHNKESGELVSGWDLQFFGQHTPKVPNNAFHPPGVFQFGDANQIQWWSDRITGQSGPVVTGEDVLSAIAYKGRGLACTDTTGVFATTSWSSANYQAFFNPQIVADILGISHGRIFMGKGPELYEIPAEDLMSWSGGSPVAGPDPFFTHEDVDWQWTAITEVGVAAIFAGNYGNKSGIYAAQLTTQDLSFGDVATIGALRQVWQAPTSEEIMDVKPFLGKGLIIGTSKGVRVAYVTDDSGNLEVTGLIVETKTPVRSVAAFGDWALFGYSQIYDPVTLKVNHGIGVIDLTDLTWSVPFLCDDYGMEYEVTGIYGVGYEAFSTTPQYRYWYWDVGCFLWDPAQVSMSEIQEVYTYFEGVPEDTNPYETQPQFYDPTIGFWGNGKLGHGWFTTGEITFGTAELKELKFLDFQVRQGYNGYDSGNDSFFRYNTVRVYYRTNTEEGWTPVIGRYQMPQRIYYWDQVDISEKLDSLVGKRIEFLFYWRVEDPISQQENNSLYSWYWPILADFSFTEWRMRARPKYKGRFRYFVPVMVYDYLDNRRGHRIGNEGYAMATLEKFKTLYRDRTEFAFQPPEYPEEGKVKKVQIENLRFKSFAPPSQAQGVGGVCLLILREVE